MPHISARPRQRLSGMFEHLALGLNPGKLRKTRQPPQFLNTAVFGIFATAIFKNEFRKHCSKKTRQKQFNDACSMGVN
jgi:hypothetical protein